MTGSIQAISVAMATFNGIAFVTQQVESILVQLQDGDQFVIVDDCSIDGTWEYLCTLSHPAVELSRQPINRGVRAAFTRALLACRNEIVFLADQDDAWLPGKREAVVRAFSRDTRVTVIVSDAELIDENGLVQATSFMASRGGFDGSVMGTIRKNRYLGCAMAFRRAILAKAMPIPSLAPMHDMWLGAIARTMGSVAYIEQPLIQYRRHDANASPSSHRSILRMTTWRVAFAVTLFLREFSFLLGVKAR